MKTLTALLVAGFLSFGILLNLPARFANDSKRDDAVMYEKAVAIIKKYESLSTAAHYPFVGYGHLVMPGEKFKRGRVLSEKEADALLRQDLNKLCAQFRSFGPDSLLLGVLAYNIGPGNVRKSSVLSKLKAGDRNIRLNYLAHCKYKGKTLRGLQRRRVEEFNTLFLHDSIFAKYSTRTSLKS